VLVQVGLVGLVAVLPTYPVLHVDVYWHAGHVEPLYAKREDEVPFALLTLRQLEIVVGLVQVCVGHRYRQKVVALKVDADENVPPDGFRPVVNVLQWVHDAAPARE